MRKKQQKASPAVEAGQAANGVMQRVQRGTSPAPQSRQRAGRYILAHKATVQCGAVLVRRGEGIAECAYRNLPERVQAFFRHGHRRPLPTAKPTADS